MVPGELLELHQTIVRVDPDELVGRGHGVVVTSGHVGPLGPAAAVARLRKGFNVIAFQGRVVTRSRLVFSTFSKKLSFKKTEPEKKLRHFQWKN